jgi:hypothetical protein
MNDLTEPLSIFGVGTVFVIALLILAFALAEAKPKAGFVLALYGLSLTIAGVLFCFLFQYPSADVLMLLTLREAPDRFAFRGLIWPGYGAVLGGLAFEGIFFAKTKIARSSK